MKRKILTILLSVVAAFAVAVGVYALFWLLDNKLPVLKNPVELRIYPTTTVEEVIETLNKEGNPVRKGSIRRAFKKEKVAKTLRPGLYKITTADPAIYIARALSRGWQNPVNIVLPPGIRFRGELAKKLSANMMVDSTELAKAFTDSLLLDKYEIRPSQLYAYVLPDTYQMYWDTSAKRIIGRLKREYDTFWNEERCAKAAKLGLTPYEVSVLASIVAQESNREDEYPKIASVYLNRLRKGMKLMACPTVCYLYDYKLRRVLFSHLKTDSPYNTYMYPGLPPTPICIPGKVHLEAVLNPDKTPYLYFCADSQFTGRNLFSTNYAQHSIYAKAYQKALTERMNSPKADALDTLLITKPEPQN